MTVKNFSSKNNEEILSLYNGNIQMNFSPGTHRYTIFHKGEKLHATCGVTTILGVLDKPQLIQWAANMTNEYWVEGIQNAKEIDEVLLFKLQKEAPANWKMKRDTAGDIGTLIHAHIEKYIKFKIGIGEDPGIPLNMLLMGAVNKFIKWEKENGITFTASEQKIYSLRHNIAGTCDFLYVTKDGKLGIGDIKSSKYIYDSFYMQLAAYRYMLEEERNYTKNATPLEYEDMTIVRVGKTDSSIEVKKVTEYKKYAQGFLACAFLYRLLHAK